jgi:hypothetical protein
MSHKSPGFARQLNIINEPYGYPVYFSHEIIAEPKPNNGNNPPAS